MLRRLRGSAQLRPTHVGKRVDRLRADAEARLRDLVHGRLRVGREAKRVRPTNASSVPRAADAALNEARSRAAAARRTRMSQSMDAKKLAAQ